MNSTWLMVRIGLALAAIFSLGIWVGRMTAPPASGPVMMFPASSGAGGEAAPRAQRMSISKVMEKYRSTLGLTDEQLETLRPSFEESGRKMLREPRRSAARLALIEQFHDEIRPLLTEDQQAKADGMLEEARRRF